MLDHTWSVQGIITEKCRKVNNYFPFPGICPEKYTFINPLHTNLKSFLFISSYFPDNLKVQSFFHSFSFPLYLLQKVRTLTAPFAFFIAHRARSSKCIFFPFSQMLLREGEKIWGQAFFGPW